MGQLKRQTLSDVFGAVGHLVFKNRKGTKYISHRPIRYATPRTNGTSISKNNRNRYKKLVICCQKKAMSYGSTPAENQLFSE
jgi:hypothetical protein